MGAGMTPFHVGMQVVCVGNGKKRPIGSPTKRLVTKGIYTIREIKSHPSWNGLLGLLFEEVTNPIHSSGWEYSYDSTCFRPIVKTDISLLEEIARKVTQGKRVKIDA